MRTPDRQFSSGFRLIPGMLICLIGIGLGQAALADTEKNSEQGVQGEAKDTQTTMTGAQVYNNVCIACHAPPGIGGAPALGNATAWAPRIAQGMDTLTDHALNGYSGSTGIMPKKGGRLDLSDQEIIGAIEYMLEQASR